MSEEQDFHTDQGDGYDDDNPYLPRTPEAFGAAWADLERLWAETTAKAQGLSGSQGEAVLHESVAGEWSFVQTLRHLLYATDLWVFAVVEGEPEPYSPLDLPFDGYERFDNPIPYERDAQPPLAEVMALREDRVARVRGVLDGLTQQRIDSSVDFSSAGWPFTETFHVGMCLATVVNEEWHHRRYAERDLDALIARGTG